MPPRVVFNTRARDEAPWEPRFRQSLPFVAVPFQTKECQIEGVRKVHYSCLVCIQAVSLVCIQAVCRRWAGVLAWGATTPPAGLATLFMKVRSPTYSHHAVHAVAYIC